MDVLEFLCIMVPILISGLLALKWIGLADSRARIELQKRLQKSKQMTSAAQRRDERENVEPDPELGAWVPELLSQFGIDPETLFEDEMPAELSRFLPMIKGFLDHSGGIQGLAQKFAGANPQDITPPRFGI